MSLDRAPMAPLEEVEWRVDSEPYERSGDTRCRFVPYLKPKTVADLLDEWVGPDGWEDDYEVITIAGKEAMRCRMSIWNGERLVTKQDVGVPSQMEAQKGAFSDAFKRAACLKWGVGRNVYDLPTLYAHCSFYEKNGKKVATPDGKKTLDDLLAQLKRLGFEANGGHVAEAETSSDEAEHAEAIPLAPEWEGDETARNNAWDDLKTRTAALPADEQNHVKADVRKAGFKLGTFTPANAKWWADLLALASPKDAA